MTPAQHIGTPPQQRPPVVEPRAGAAALAELLTEPPPAAEQAAQQVAAVAASLAAGDLAVLVHDPDGGVLLAGRVPGPDGTAVAAAGRVTLVCAAGELPPEHVTLLRQACAWISAALERDGAIRAAGRASAEGEVVRDVVGRLLSVRDVDQVLLSVAHRTLRLLDADICGVLLREGDEVRMRSVVGNRVVETSRLRMRRGQGVAGLVFLTGEPARVDDYLADRTISQDFMTLAEQEETRSALAIPLRLQGEFIGVLEVWRRRPSVFTDEDVRRMVVLADVATVAIDNARLLDEQAAALAQLQHARDELEQQVAVLARSAKLQDVLLDAVLDGIGLPAVARGVALELDCQVGIYGPDGALITAHAGHGLVTGVPSVLPATTLVGRTALRLVDGTEADAWVQPVHADGDRFGSVCLLLGRDGRDLMAVAAGQVAMACSLTLVRERAASRARAEELEQVLWDLLQGPVGHRIAARSRAKQLQVPLRGPLRVLAGQLENIEELAARNGWDTSQTDRVRRDVLRALRSAEGSRALSLAGLRGNLLAGVVSDAPAPAIRELLVGVTAAARRDLAGLRLTWGVSRAHDGVVELPSAMQEARTALAAAHRLGGENAYFYEELGIVRLLLCSGSDPDLQAFIDDVTGPLIAYDENNDGSLVRTLRAFFDADCNQRLAAERLFIHHKTLRYRLEQIRQHTGLDLSRHEDRMRADLALRLLQVNRVAEDPVAGDLPA